MKKIKVVKSFEDALIAAFETGNMETVKISDEGFISIYGLDRPYWPEGEKAELQKDGSYMAKGFYIPGWALDSKEVESIPEKIKTINQLILDFNCNDIPCQECVFRDHERQFCMLIQIRNQTDAKYPGAWE